MSAAEEKDLPELPEGWAWTTLGEIGTWGGGGTPSKANTAYWTDGTVPWVSPKDMKSPVLEGAQDHITEEAASETAAQARPANSIAFVVRSGILERTLPVALVPFRAAYNQDMKVLTPSSEIDVRWLLWALRGDADSILRDCRKDGTTVASIDFDKLKARPLPLPPKQAQSRVVAFVESAIDNIDSADHALIEAQDLVARLQDSVYTHALRPWADRVTPLRELIREPLKNGHSAKATADGSGIRTLTLTSVTRKEFVDEHTKMTSAAPAKVKDIWLTKGDVLIQRSNTPDLVGCAALYDGPNDWAIFPDLLIRVRPSARLLPEFLEIVLSAPTTRQHVRSVAKGSAGSMPKIAQDDVGAIPIPLPDPEIQRRIVNDVAADLAAVRDLAHEVEAARAGGLALRRTVLHAALMGDGATPDPSDEPASVLLDRIRAEREAAEAEAKAAKKASRAKKKPAEQLALDGASGNGSAAFAEKGTV